MTTITFTAQPDGRITADGFPMEILVERHLLEAADDTLLRVVGQEVHSTVANGTARYLLVGPADDFLGRDVLHARRLCGELT